ncbi:aspartic proteinase 36-like isoform X2 [Humulus lupulus]|uniref:aspartic proteinase 36-like isoform X2 n=1 Tax=Humulus lupulus TaxID=3486 RepID=UPI002B404C24|nr:aspartic proteinase 36-like isoform X2 [Humulus lupulus]
MRASQVQLVVAVVALLHTAALMHGFPSSSRMTLKRAFPTNHRVELSQLRARDALRHNSVISFPVGGTFNPSLVGLYYAEIKLGSPPEKFHVQIDTGSDVLWVNCRPCIGCPIFTDLQTIELNSYDPVSSNTSSLISCKDQICKDGVRLEESLCSFQTNRCIYSFLYGDGSTTTGFYVSDLLSFETIGGRFDIDSRKTNSSASIVFGCSNIATGELSRADSATDGIFGLGQHKMSVISQLSSQGVAPKVFSHCLKGDDNGGGILVFGDIVEPNMVYTPLVPSQLHYNINLLNIYVNGQVVLPIDSREFTLSTSNGTIVDSGTTLAYLPKNVYDSFVKAVDEAASKNARLVPLQGFQCYSVDSSIINSTFPQVSFNFSGGASMVLKPKDYLLEQNSTNQNEDTTVLGDLVLKDKIVVYDLANQRIGWTDYDCSMPVDVSTNTSSETELVKVGAPISSTFQKEPSKIMILISIVTLLVYIATLVDL